MRSLHTLLGISLAIGSLTAVACSSGDASSTDTGGDTGGTSAGPTGGTNGTGGKATGGTSGLGGTGTAGAAAGTAGSGTAGTGTAGTTGKGGSGTGGKGGGTAGTAGKGGSAGTGTGGAGGSGTAGTAGKGGSGTAGTTGKGGSAGAGTGGTSATGGGAGTTAAGAGGTSATGGAGGAGGAASCDVGGCGDTQCNDCQTCALAGVCKAASDVCDANAECGALITCVNMCTTQACVQSCGAMHPGGVMDTQALVNCLFTTACPDTCASPCPTGTGGAGGGAGAGGSAGTGGAGAGGASGTGGAAGAGGAAACDPVLGQLSGCGMGQKCTALLDTTANTVNATCEPVMANTVQNGADCTRTMLGIDNCKAGAVCTGTGVADFDATATTPHRVCQTFCKADGDCSVGNRCEAFTDDGWGICVPTCAAFSACPTNQTCGLIATDNDAAAKPLDFLGCRTRGNTATGAACTQDIDCTSNRLCIDPTGGGNAVCTAICDATHNCTGGKTCQKFDMSDAFGVCLLGLVGECGRVRDRAGTR